MVEGVAQGLGNHRCPGIELLFGGCIPCYQSLINSGAAQGPPLVVVTFQPGFMQIGKLPIPGDVCRGQMVMIIDNRLFRRHFMVQPPGGIRGEKEIVVQEFLHKPDAPITRCI